MASQQYFHPSIQPDYKPMYLTGDTIPLYYANAGSQAMNRYQVSNDSTNSSGSSFSVTAMSNGAGSPDSAFYDNDYVYNQSSYLEPSPSTAVSGTGLETLPRETPASLDWCPNSELLKLYKFVVQKSKEPHFELRSEFDITPRTPKKVYLDQPGIPEKDIFQCQYPNSCGARFKRPADLDRHYKNVHADEDQRDRFECDYPKCQKGRAPFYRKDHFRDHLRDYHKEDIGSAKREKTMDNDEWQEMQEAWIEERIIHAKWWRCPKDLHRIKIKRCGYICPACNLSCEEERVSRIQMKTACQNCGNSGYIWNADGIYQGPCPYCCQPAGEQYFYGDGEAQRSVW